MGLRPFLGQEPQILNGNAAPPQVLSTEAARGTLHYSSLFKHNVRSWEEAIQEVILNSVRCALGPMTPMNRGS
jgi:hypothetical protein